MSIPGADLRLMKALLKRAPLLVEWLSSNDLNPEAVDRGRQVQRFIVEVKLLTIQGVREEVQALTKQIEGEKNPERVRALGDVLEKLNVRYERLERELLEEDDASPEPVVYDPKKPRKG